MDSTDAGAAAPGGASRAGGTGCVAASGVPGDVRAAVDPALLGATAQRGGPPGVPDAGAGVAPPAVRLPPGGGLTAQGGVACERQAGAPAVAQRGLKSAEKAAKKEPFDRRQQPERQP